MRCYAPCGAMHHAVLCTMRCYAPCGAVHLPGGGGVVLEEEAPAVVVGVEAGEGGIADAGGAVDDVEGRGEAVHRYLHGGEGGGIFVGDPAGVDGVHVDAVADVVDRRGAREHVERGLGHVGV